MSPLQVPALEPASAEPPAPRPLATPFIDRTVPESVPPPPVEAEEDRGPRWRRGKAKDKKTSPKGGETAPAQEEEGDPGWRLDDVLGPGGGKK